MSMQTKTDQDSARELVKRWLNDSEGPKSQAEDFQFQADIQALLQRPPRPAERDGIIADIRAAAQQVFAAVDAGQNVVRPELKVGSILEFIVQLELRDCVDVVQSLMDRNDTIFANNPQRLAVRDRLSEILTAYSPAKK